MSAPQPSSGKQRAPSNVENATLTPFRHRAFAILWSATVISNVGVWMQNAAAGWLMTTLTNDPFLVSMVQVATSVPLFLLALPAGALADILDRRMLLIAVQATAAIVAGVFGYLVHAQLVSPDGLLVFIVTMGATAALITPAWYAIVPQLVPAALLRPAVALNGVGVNISRAIGPALAGLIIAAWGIASPFWLDAASTLVVIAALLWWKPPAEEFNRLPPERFSRAIAAGLRHARNNMHLRATLIRGGGFFVVASAYWALLPLTARHQIDGGPALYGLLLGGIGAGAVSGAFTLPFFNRRLGPDRLVAAGVAGTAVALVLFGLAQRPVLAVMASLLAGVSWILVLATMTVSAQVVLPAWVRGRGLSVFVAVMFGSLTVGSALWGKVAAWAGLPAAHVIAAVCALASVPLLWRWKLQPSAALDLTPSMHWQDPVLAQDVGHDRGPVLVTVEYHIDPERRDAFLRTLGQLGGERRRDGAFDWWVFEDVAVQGRFVETFMLDSWVDHLRQHARVSNTARALQERVDAFQLQGKPVVTHLIASTP